ncbi:MAG: hypothetical protein JWP50_1993 [Phenylobacterium sp.]|nr:hypothetical protein [Phenylobacterium sp.]
MPVEPKGDFEPDTLYASVGRALSAWEMAEGMLGRIFALLCSADFPGAERAYGVVSSFSGRRDMLEQAFESYPGRTEPVVRDLPALLTKFHQFSARRNEIAHGILWYFSGLDENFGNYLVPATYNSRKRISPEAFNALRPMTTDVPWHAALKYAYTSSQIDYYGRQFFHLAGEALLISDALGQLAAAAYEEKFSG